MCLNTVAVSNGKHSIPSIEVWAFLGKFDAFNSPHSFIFSTKLKYSQCLPYWNAVFITNNVAHGNSSSSLRGLQFNQFIAYLFGFVVRVCKQNCLLDLSHMRKQHSYGWHMITHTHTHPHSTCHPQLGPCNVYEFTVSSFLRLLPICIRGCNAIAVFLGDSILC